MFQVKNGTCVFWYELPNGDGTGWFSGISILCPNWNSDSWAFFLCVCVSLKGYWSTHGCETTNTGENFICSCTHLSFFAVLVVKLHHFSPLCHSVLSIYRDATFCLVLWSNVEVLKTAFGWVSTWHWYWKPHVHQTKKMTLRLLLLFLISSLEEIKLTNLSNQRQLAWLSFPHFQYGPHWPPASKL